MKSILKILLIMQTIISVSFTGQCIASTAAAAAIAIDTANAGTQSAGAQLITKYQCKKCLENSFSRAFDSYKDWLAHVRYHVFTIKSGIKAKEMPSDLSEFGPIIIKEYGAQEPAKVKQPRKRNRTSEKEEKIAKEIEFNTKRSKKLSKNGMSDSHGGGGGGGGYSAAAGAASVLEASREFPGLPMPAALPERKDQLTHAIAAAQAAQPQAQALAPMSDANEAPENGAGSLREVVGSNESLEENPMRPSMGNQIPIGPESFLDQANGDKYLPLSPLREIE